MRRDDEEDDNGDDIRFKIIRIRKDRGKKFYKT